MITVDWSMLAIIASLASSVAYLTWWLSGQFANIRHLMYDRIDKVEHNLITKLEYHEKHDDQRFAEIRNDLWAIRVRNAAKDEMLRRVGLDYSAEAENKAILQDLDRVISIDVKNKNS